MTSDYEKGNFLVDDPKIYLTYSVTHTIRKTKKKGQATSVTTHLLFKKCDLNVISCDHRVSCLLLVAIGVLWVPIIQNVAGSRLFTYMQQVQNILSPPVSAVFLLAVFWPRTNEPVRHD